MSLVQDFVRHLIPAKKVNPNGWTSFNCPVCTFNGQTRHDTRKRGGVKFPDADSFQYNCFNCHFTTGWSPGKGLSSRAKLLFKQLGASDSDIQRVQLDLMREKEQQDLMNAWRKKEEHVPFDPQWSTMNLPANSVPLLESDSPFAKEGIAYLQDRGVLDLGKWYWSDLEAFNMFCRVILPLTYKGQIVGYHARWIGKPPSKDMAKVIKEQPKDYVYGCDLQVDTREYILVVEGEYDALSIGGISIGSNAISANQADIINSFGKTVIAVPDRDKAGLKFSNDAIEHGWALSFPEWDSDIKDVADACQRYGRLFTLRMILDAVETNPVKLQVLARTHCE
jgi:hypothetical protein